MTNIDIVALYKIYQQHYSIVTDTRKIKNGDVFFALKGPNFNGNQFALQALQQGAIAVVIDEEIETNDERVFKCNDCLLALQELAKFHRNTLQIPVIGITGSNGKTTTKELVHAVMCSHFKTYTTVGNLNNHIGVPLTLLSILPDAQIAIIEMGANHKEEIASYCEYAQPTHGFITNCGKAHLEGFGGEEGIKKGKGELFDFLRKSDGSALIFNDYDYLNTMSMGINEIFTYGSTNADVLGQIVKSDTNFLTLEIISHPQIGIIKTQLVGDYNFPNVMAAVAMGIYAYVDDEKIKKAIENYKPDNSRSQAKKIGENNFILDAYNANPSSMKLAIENLAKINGDKVLLLGSMKELGDDTQKEHEEILKIINSYQWKAIALVGPEFEKVNNQFPQFENSVLLKQWLQNQAFKNTTILLKGSRGSKMELAIEDL